MKVLVVDTTFMGDQLMCSPAYKMLKSNLSKGSRVHVLSWDMNRPVLSKNPHIDRIWTVNDGSTLQSILMLIHLRTQKYDMVCQLNTSLKTNLLMLLVGAKYRLGYDYKWCGFPLNIKVPINTRTALSEYRPFEVCKLFHKAFGWDMPDPKMIWR